MPIAACGIKLLLNLLAMGTGYVRERDLDQCKRATHNSPDVERTMRDTGAAAFHTKEAAVELRYQTIQRV
jgi:hypothetical protein